MTGARSFGVPADAAGAGDIAAHEADTTNVHGITNTAALETTTGAQAKADAALTAAAALVDDLSGVSDPATARTNLGLGVARWLTPMHGGLATTSQLFTVGRVLLLQFVVPVACTIDGLSYVVGAVSAGNVTGGIIGPVTRTGDTANAGAVLAQSASTAQGTATTAQLLTWTPVAVAAGIYYAALEGSDATGTYARQSNQAQALGLVQHYDRDAGYGALTDPTPAVTDTGSAAPGIRIRLA